MKRLASLLVGLIAAMMLSVPASAAVGSPGVQNIPDLPAPAADSPDTVTIGDPDVPLEDASADSANAPEVYVKTQVSDSDYMYIPESEVPLADVPIDRDVQSPQTGTASAQGLVVLALIAGFGAVALTKKAVVA